MTDEEEKRPTIKLPSVGPVWTTTQEFSATIIPWNQPAAPAGPLGIINYESNMLVRLIDARAQVEELELSSKRTVINALTESALLHARILCSIFLNEGRGTEIKLNTILGQLSPTEEQRRTIDDAVHKLEEAYGKESDHNSSRFIINSMVMHPTPNRGDYGVYDGVVSKLAPVIDQVMTALQTLV